LAPVFNIGANFRPPGVHFVERDINYVPNSFEPLRQNRFLITFPPELNIPSYLVKDVTTPSIKVSNSVHSCCEDIIVTFYDSVDYLTQKRLYDIITNPKSNNSHNNKFTIEMIDSIGDVVYKWNVYGFISGVENTLLDYHIESSIVLKLTIVVNYFELIN